MFSIVNDCDKMTDDLEWCQVQSNTPGKGNHTTAIICLIISSQLVISTEESILRFAMNSTEKVTRLTSGKALQ